MPVHEGTTKANTSSMPTPFAEGDIVNGLDPNELVEITKVAPFAGKTLVEGFTQTTRRQIRKPLSSDELETIAVVRKATSSFDGDPIAFQIGSEALRIRTAYQFDPLFAVSSSVVDPLPHQIEAVYRFLLPMPRIRFLLADDTGAGKTIMTGLLMKELLFRGVIEKALIITPGGLTQQWVDEMDEKFGLRFRLVNRASFDTDPSQFMRTNDGLFVTSIDFISRYEACLKSAEAVPWDMIVVDEAHKLSAYEYKTKVDRSARYTALERLAPQTDHLLFLTATPHRGRKDTFRRLLMLLDPDLFQKDEFVTEHMVRESRAQWLGTEDFTDEKGITKARNRFFLRRLKEEMVDWNGEPLFKDRHTTTVGYNLTDEEMALYQAVTKYVQAKRKQAQAQKNRNVELTLMVMQRRLASSIYAITRTLQNRVSSLEEVLKLLHDPNRSDAEKRRFLRLADEPGAPSDISEYEEMDEKEREEIDKRIFRQVLTSDLKEVKKERDEVAFLLEMAEKLSRSEHREAKFQELLRVLDVSDVIRHDSEKLVIFTEHRDTLDSLTKRLRSLGYSVVNIHGQMNVEERKQAQRTFYDKAKIMVATDAAGEGINLQFCRYLINWDIPWNPNRLEQRMGRIHRYGQQDEVHVYNLVAQDTREGKVLQRILLKLDTMREQMTDRVYDVVSDMLEDVDLVDLIDQVIDTPDEEQVVEVVESRLNAPSLQEKVHNLIELQKKTSLASHLDLPAVQQIKAESDERRLQPWFVQRFFQHAYQVAQGTLRTESHNDNLFYLDQTPQSLIELARTERRSLSEMYKMPFVFNKDLISVASDIRVPETTRLMGPGHELFDMLIEWAIRNASEAFAKGATLVDPSITSPQHVWLVRSTIEDGRSDAKKRLAHEKLSLVLVNRDGLFQVSPAYLLNCTYPDSVVVSVLLSMHPPLQHSYTIEEIQEWTYTAITEPQLEQVKTEREKESELRRIYLETAFTDLIVDLQAQLGEYQKSQLQGYDEPEKRQNLEKRLRDLRERKTNRLAELELMVRLSSNFPEVVAEARILPAPEVALDYDESATHPGVPMRRDDEVEAIAMDIAMHYERSRNWTPYDVSNDGEHYDVRSEGPAGERRYIEVKGRSTSGAIMLTSPELDKLRQLGNQAWLYIVTHCKSEQPCLRIIQNPAQHISPHMLYRQVQWLVNEDDWQRASHEPRP